MFIIGAGSKLRADAAEVTVERLFGEGRGRIGHGQRNAQDRVGAELASCWRAVEFDHCVSIADLVDRVPAAERIGNDRR